MVAAQSPCNDVTDRWVLGYVSQLLSFPVPAGEAVRPAAFRREARYGMIAVLTNLPSPRGDGLNQPGPRCPNLLGETA